RPPHCDGGLYAGSEWSTRHDGGWDCVFKAGRFRESDSRRKATCGQSAPQRENECTIHTYDNTRQGSFKDAQGQDQITWPINNNNFTGTYGTGSLKLKVELRTQDPQDPNSPYAWYEAIGH